MTRWALLLLCSVLVFSAAATTALYTLSLHDALPISRRAVEDPLDLIGLVQVRLVRRERAVLAVTAARPRSEEHTSELQSHSDLVCRLLLEKKKRASRAPREPATLRGDRSLPVRYRST